MTAIRMAQRRFDRNSHSRGSYIRDFHRIFSHGFSQMNTDYLSVFIREIRGNKKVTTPEPFPCIQPTVWPQVRLRRAAAASRKSENKANTRRATKPRHALVSPTSC